jgi:hypothetical protein
MPTLSVKRAPGEDREEVSIENPLPVSIEAGDDGQGSVPTRVRRITTEMVVVPGVGVGAHAADDAVGTRFIVPVGTRSGVIEAVILVDLAAQTGAYDLLLFDADFTAVADDAPFDLTDTERGRFVGGVNIPSAAGVIFGATETLYTVKDIQFPFTAPAGVLYAQLTTQGTPTFAVGDVSLRFVIRMDA